MQLGPERDGRCDSADQRSGDDIRPSVPLAFLAGRESHECTVGARRYNGQMLAMCWYCRSNNKYEKQYPSP